MKPKPRAVRLPAAVVRSEEFHSLSGAALKLLLAIASRLDCDNGAIAMSVASAQEAIGMARPSSTHKATNAIRELEGSGLATRTRARHGAPSLWRLSWLPATTATGAKIPASFGMARDEFVAAVRAEYERILNDAGAVSEAADAGA